MAVLKYKRGEGTGGMEGQLYETKLNALVLFRLLNDKNVQEFYLASNYADIGKFDDICIKAKVDGRTILIIVQAKHKEKDEAHLDYDLLDNLLSSFFKVKEKISLCNARASTDVNDKQNDLFSGQISECLFVLYTNGIYSPDKYDRVAYEDIFSNRILFTGDTDSHILKPKHTDKTLVTALKDKILEEEIARLADNFTKFLTTNSMNIMQDECIKRYHVILARYVVNISESIFQEVKKNPECTEIQEYRTLTFRSDFFHTNNKIASTFRKQMCDRIFENSHNKRNNNEGKNENVLLQNTSTDKLTVNHTGDALNSDVSEARNATVEEQIHLFLREPSALTLSPLIGNHIVYKDNSLKFVNKRPSTDQQKLAQIIISPKMIDEVKEIVAKSKLPRELKVPVAFGNVDYTFKKKFIKRGKWITFFVEKIKELCKKSNLVGAYNVIAIEETDGFSEVSRGINTAIGNLLVRDIDNNYLMFTKDRTALKNNARTLLDKLVNEIHDLHSYRFDMQHVINYSRLVFDDYTEEATEMLKTVIVFENQSSQSGVETILKNEINAHEKLSHSDLVKFDNETIYLYYHNNVQEWWLEKGESTYQTKANNLYKKTLNNMRFEPCMSLMHNSFYMNNVKYYKYDFTEHAVETLRSMRENSKIIIVTHTSTLSVMKVIRFLRKKSNYNHSVVDLEIMLRLPSEEYDALNLELKNTDKDLIIVCNKVKNDRILHKRLNKLTEVTHNKNYIIITEVEMYEVVTDYFDSLDVTIDDKKLSLIDLTVESRRDILKDTEVSLQGRKINLDLLVEPESDSLIRGAMLYNILSDKTTVIGKPLSDAKYEEIKHLYIDRKVLRGITRKEIPVYTFYDIEDDVVLITSTPGMGKSTLLTHLSIETNKRYMVWIVKVNLLEQTDDFEQWTNSKGVLDTLQTLKFMYQVTSGRKDLKIDLKEINNDIHLVNHTGDDKDLFELNLFLQFYNERKLIYLLDGFDEICPHLKENVMKFIKVVKNHPRRHKLWVSSRPYSEILPDLETVLGETYHIATFNTENQKEFLKRFWEDKILLKNASEERVSNVLTMLDKPIKFSNVNLRIVCYYFCDFLRSQDFGLTHYKHKDLMYGYDVLLSTFWGSPLLLFLFADYLANTIVDNEIVFEINLSLIYLFNYFIESKLKMFLIDKYFRNLSKPYDRAEYEEKLAERKAMYKKIAAFNVFKPTLFTEQFRFNEFKNMPFKEQDVTDTKAIIEDIEKKTDPTGLISYVAAGNIPVFIHMSFTEYFAAEYICDILKNSAYDSKCVQLLYITLYTYCKYVVEWLHEKRESDKELDSIIKKIESNKPIGLSPSVRSFFQNNVVTPEQNIRLMNWPVTKSSALVKRMTSFLSPHVDGTVFQTGLYILKSNVQSKYLHNKITNLVKFNSVEILHDYHVDNRYLYANHGYWIRRAYEKRRYFPSDENWKLGPEYITTVPIPYRRRHSF